MRRTLRILAAVVAIATLGFWLGKGAHPGWTKDRVTETKIDPVTELPYPVTQEEFVPGVDFLGMGLVAAGALFVGSLFVRRKNKPQQNQTKSNPQ
jgi:hypothetical protein